MQKKMPKKQKKKKKNVLVHKITNVRLIFI